MTGDDELLSGVEAVVREAGTVLLDRFSTEARPANGRSIIDALEANDVAASAVLDESLWKLRPGVPWASDDLSWDDPLVGEWWVVDPVEGNINHVHGMTGWGVTATLVRDGAPVLTVVDLPALGRTYTARVGSGAWENGRAMRSSAKTRLSAALVGTGQSSPGEDPRIHQRLGASVAAMLRAALMVRVSVPSTLQLVDVAAGRADVFWQYAAARSGAMAGALLVTEADGVVSDTHGRSWDRSRPDLLACAPGLHDQVVEILSTLP